MNNHSLLKRVVSEFFGTFCLTFVGCGAAVGVEGNVVAIAISFGGILMALIYIIGPISGCHVNPAVSLSMLLNSRIKLVDTVLYVIVQIIGATFAGFLLLAVEFTTEKMGVSGYGYGLGENGFASASQHGINIGGGIMMEVFMTFVFVTIVLVSTSNNNTIGDKAGVVIGVTLSTLVGAGVTFTGTSLNPARSFGPAIALLCKKQTRAITQFWVFLIAPLGGAVCASLFTRFVLGTEADCSSGEINGSTKGESDYKKYQVVND